MRSEPDAVLVLRTRFEDRAVGSELDGELKGSEAVAQRLVVLESRHDAGMFQLKTLPALELLMTDKSMLGGERTVWIFLPHKWKTLNKNLREFSDVTKNRTAHESLIT